ncbi:glycosyltransferase [Kitasatospora sp. MMS16-BH015]|uniref:glycosyltransferase n=1 Tax=Kitasatospora sp. MMS16-BH015 TaxID=2018025 RepID=UPI000CA19D62|nr:glycosyltransferase [Kitasatospora sp. MMS16-BH015]AUG78772.1 glycosyltransferase [Kitasatospora sp. MMS16-BH015]
MRILLAPMSDPGFLFPALAVGRELRRRGHQVTVAGRPGAAGVAEAAGLEFRPIGADEGFDAIRWYREGEAQYRAVREAARATGADALLTSVLCQGALPAAETLGLPVAVLGLATHLWPYASGGEGEPPQRSTREWRQDEMADRYRKLRADLGLAAQDEAAARRALLGDGFLLRGAAALEFPGAVLPEGVHQIGPCWWEPTAPEGELAALDERLARSGKPVVYVHLGRTFDHPSLWSWLARLFTGTPWQAVVELGRTPDLATDPSHRDLHAVRKPWMGPLLDRAELVLTNATTAPVLGALLHRRPLLVAPTGGEQLLLAAACLRAGIAHLLPDSPDSPDSPGGPAELLRAAATDPSVRARIDSLGRSMTDRQSAFQAADFVEKIAR